MGKAASNNPKKRRLTRVVDLSDISDAESADQPTVFDPTTKHDGHDQSTPAKVTDLSAETDAQPTTQAVKSAKLQAAKPAGKIWEHMARTLTKMPIR